MEAFGFSSVFFHKISKKRKKQLPTGVEIAILTPTIKRLFNFRIERSIFS